VDDLRSFGGSIVSSATLNEGSSRRIESTRNLPGLTVEHPDSDPTATQPYSLDCTEKGQGGRGTWAISSAVEALPAALMASADSSKWGSLLQDDPEGSKEGEEVFQPLSCASLPGGALPTRVVRIVSNGQATPEGEWYDQEDHEWVCLVSGEAGLLLKGEAEPRHMRAGDWCLLPKHCLHRVAWTSASEKTVWLAFHFDGDLA
jgi:cupin 2 domain-containing protein